MIATAIPEAVDGAHTVPRLGHKRVECGTGREIDCAQPRELIRDQKAEAGFASLIRGVLWQYLGRVVTIEAGVD